MSSSTRRDPEIIAHRGASREYRENTLRAFARAIELGADGIELDVHGTADGVVVVHHDSTVQLQGARGSSLITLREQPFSVIAAGHLASGDPMPTLDDVLEMVGDRATVYVEVKAQGIERELCACLDRHAQVRSAVHAFDHRIPVRIRDRRPATPIGVLSDSYSLAMAEVVRAARPAALWQQSRLIDAALVRIAHKHGARVIAWTENDPAHARALVALGVDAICTDTPGEMRNWLAT